MDDNAIADLEEQLQAANDRIKELEEALALAHEQLDRDAGN